MSYASDLRAAAEAEREAREQAGIDGTVASFRREQSDRIALTIPDRLLPLLDKVDRLIVASRLVVRAADDSTMVTDEWVKQTLEPALDDPEGA